MPRCRAFRLRQEEGRSHQARGPRIRRHQGCQGADGPFATEPVARHRCGAAKLGSDPADHGAPIGHLPAHGQLRELGDSLHGDDSAGHFGARLARGPAEPAPANARVRGAPPDNAHCGEVPHDGGRDQAGDGQVGPRRGLLPCCLDTGVSG